MEDTNLKEIPGEEPTTTQPPEAPNTERPAGDWTVADKPAGDWQEVERPEVDIKTPSTEDRAKVKAPDDTFPGSGPAHMQW